MASRPPEYRLKMLDKKNGAKYEIGAGWLNKDGSISLRLNPGTYLHDNPDWVLTLFINDRKPGEVKEQPE